MADLMSWKDRLIGPRWEHKDPEVRARAVAELDDPKLKKQLPDLAVDDPDPRVRLQAMLRVDHEVLWLRHGLQDPDETIRKQAAQRAPRLVLRADSEDELSPIRQQWIRDSDDREFLQRVATHSPLLSLRRTALEKVDSPGFLGNRVIDEPDDDLALSALERISQGSTLDRIADKLRRSNKTRYRWVLDRLAGGSEPSGESESESADQRYQQIVRNLELLARGEYNGNRKERLEALRKQWKSLPRPPEAALVRRFEGAERIVEASFNQQPRPTVEPLPGRIRALLESTDRQEISDKLEALRTETGQSPEAAVEEAIAEVETHLAGLDIKPHDSLQEVADRIARAMESSPDKVGEEQVRELTASWDRAWSGLDRPTAGDQRLKNTVIGQLAGLREKAAMAASKKKDKPAPANPAEAEKHLDAADKALEAGELVPAHKALGKARSAIDRLPGKQAGPLRGRLNQSSGKLKEMRDWQHWSNNKIRRRLIREIEALPEAGLHPDAISARLKDAREQWSNLDSSEKMPGDQRQFAAPPAEWRRFQAACRKAHETAKPFFEKRSAIQQTRLDEIEQFMDEAGTAADDDSTGHPEIRKRLNEARKAIRQVGDLPPESRGATANRLKALMDRLNQRLEDHADQVEQRKQQLVREAQKLAHEKDTTQAMETAKGLQAEWKKAGGSHRRRKEQELWKAFREPIDPLFEQARDERKAKEEEQSRQREEWLALCKEAEKLASVEDSELEAAQGPMAGLAETLGQNGSPDIRKRFSRAEEKLAGRLEALARKQAKDRLADQSRLAELLQQAWDLREKGLDGSSADELKKAMAENPESGRREDMTETMTRLLDPDSDQKALEAEIRDNTEKARQVLVEMEFLAGIPSPEEDRQQRMDYQVQRLSAHLGGDHATSGEPAEEAEALRVRWLEAHPVETGRFKTYKSRFTKAHAGLEEMLDT